MKRLAAALRARRAKAAKRDSDIANGEAKAAVRAGAHRAIPTAAAIRRTPAGLPPRARSSILKQAACACESALADAGIRALVVGSLAYGGVRPESDLDLLIVSYRGKKWSEVSSIAESAARLFSVPVDVIFGDTLPPAILKAMLKDARRASLL